eukprot:1916474-Prymnesium_polylepis.1
MPTSPSARLPVRPPSPQYPSRRASERERERKPVWTIMMSRLGEVVVKAHRDANLIIVRDPDIMVGT